MADSRVSLYDLLGVSKHATDAEIEESYNNLAKEFHPEDAVDKLKEITFAYEVLSDPEKRTIYDRYGIMGLQDGDSELTGGGSDSESLFSKFFSHTTDDDIQIPLFVTLEELYNRVETKTVTYKRCEICTDCHAVEGDPTKEEFCTQCVGFGLSTSMGLLVSGCDVCNGRGKIIKGEFQCKTCEDKGFCENENTVNVKIEPGMPHMERICIRSEGHQNKAGDRGHLVVLIHQEPHSVFQRQLSNLYIDQAEISLIQALCGLEYTFKHLDGRNLVVRTQPGHVIKPNAMMVVKGEGMPKFNNPLEKGDLFISFSVRMPEDNFANAEVMNKLEEILPPRTPFTMPTGEDVEEVQLVEIQPRENYEASDDDASVGQCAFS